MNDECGVNECVESRIDELAVKYATEPRREGNVYKEITGLQQAIAELEKSICALRSKLDPITDNCKEAGFSDETADRAMMCPLAEEIRNKREQIEFQVRLLGLLNNKIEL